MNNRPEHVKCENCCYWDCFYGPDGDDPKPHSALGYCRRYPPSIPWPEVAKINQMPEAAHEFGGWCITEDSRGCGEFRAEWPGQAVEFVKLVPAVELTTRARRALGILGVAADPLQVARLTPRELMAVKGCGPGTVQELCEWVKRYTKEE